MKRISVLILAAALVAAAPVSSPAQTPAPIHIVVNAAALAGLPRVTVTAYDAHAKTTNIYSGVSLHALLVRAGAPDGEALRGKGMVSYVLIGAADGYRVLYALAEIDPSYQDKVVIVADSMDGKPLPDGVGPFRIVAVGEKRPGRWAHEITTIDVVAAP